MKEVLYRLIFSRHIKLDILVAPISYSLMKKKHFPDKYFFLLSGGVKRAHEDEPKDDMMDT